VSGGNEETVRRFLWDIAAVNIHLDEIRQFWARILGISGPQWMILMAVSDLDKGDGVPVKDVSAMLHVDSSFVTTQSKILEKNGFVRRVPSRDDARVGADVPSPTQSLQADRQGFRAPGDAQ